jgi:phosphohistidine swiveling domain-containing protein
VQSLQSYLAIEDGPLTPDRVFARGCGEAELVLETIFPAARKKPLGRTKELLLRFFAGRMRALMGIRESPKFLIIRMMGFLREGFLESGRSLLQAETIHQADDIFFLHLRELESIAKGNTSGWKSIVAKRRSRFEREMRRRRIPRILLSDGRAYFESTPSTGASSSTALTGDPVSPGIIEGRARVILDPRGARLEAGEILVCPGTDPSWTPLFLSAGGLVMEVGGMMTHGSVVAREYGIPAVVGVDFVTEKLKTGDWVRVDGTRGVIEILPSKENDPVPGMGRSQP